MEVPGRKTSGVWFNKKKEYEKKRKKKKLAPVVIPKGISSIYASLDQV